MSKFIKINTPIFYENKYLKTYVYHIFVVLMHYGYWIQNT